VGDELDETDSAYAFYLFGHRDLSLGYRNFAAVAERHRAGSCVHDFNLNNAMV